MNLTDVDDRIIAAALAAGQPLRATWSPSPRPSTKTATGCGSARLTSSRGPPSSSAPMIELVQRLVDKGVAYKGEDGSVYFAIDRFPA